MRATMKKWLLFAGMMTGTLAVGYFTQKDASSPFENAVPYEQRLPISIQDNLTRSNIVLMGSEFVFVIDEDHDIARKAITDSVNEIKHLEEQISSWKPNSEITLLNHSAGIKPVKISHATMDVLKLAKTLHTRTSGAFDITIEPVWDLWPFRVPTKPIPTDEAISDKLALVNASMIELDEARMTAYLPQEGMKVNLGGIGKGYAARVAIETLKNMGVERAAVSAGGDTYLLGEKTTGRWVVGIENPMHEGHFIDRFFAANTSVATSGNTKRFFERDGKRYGHILNPKTGYPADFLLSVTIRTKDPAVADALATAVYVMGIDEGMKWVETQDGVEVLIVDDNGDVHRSGGWATDPAVAPKQPPVAQAAAPQKSSVSRTTPAVAIQYSRPQNTDNMVRVGDILVDLTEVSNKEYRQYLESGPWPDFRHPQQPGKEALPRYWKEFRPALFRKSIASQLAPFNGYTFKKTDHPVVGVDWWDAYGYCYWAGKRLATLKEWASIRGASTWPWGDQWDYQKANTGGERNGENDGYIYSAPVRSFESGRTSQGVYHVAGNVAEWTAEGAVVGGSSNSSPSGVGPQSITMREPLYRSFDIGIRCVSDE